jgi:hypothetical protein
MATCYTIENFLDEKGLYGRVHCIEYCGNIFTISVLIERQDLGKFIKFFNEHEIQVREYRGLLDLIIYKYKID